MGIIRSGVGTVLVFILTISLVATNGVVLADRTALDGDFVKSTLSENDAYEAMQTVAVDEASTRLAGFEDQVPIEVDTERVIRETLTTEYLEHQVETNVDRVYGFLHGEEDTLYIAVNLSPIKENVGALVEARIQNMTVSEMVGLVASQDELTVDFQGVTLDLAVVGEMAEGPDAYREARQSFRDDIVAQLVQDQFEQRSNDELIQLIGYDPDEYTEEEKEQLVQENEAEIKDALESAIRDSDLVDEQLENLGGSIEDLVESTVSGAVSEQFQPLVDPATRLVLTGTDGLTQDMAYATFSDRLETAKADLAANASIVVRSELDTEVEDQFVLSDELPASVEEDLQLVQSAVGIVGLLALVLPAVSLVLVGLLYLVTGSLAATAFGAGVSATTVGGASYLGASMVPGILESSLPAADLPAAAVDLLHGIIASVAGALGAQSLLLLAIGVIAIIAGVVLRFRDEGDSGGRPPEATPADAGGDDATDASAA